MKGNTAVGTLLVVTQEDCPCFLWSFSHCTRTRARTIWVARMIIMGFIVICRSASHCSETFSVISLTSFIYRSRYRSGFRSVWSHDKALFTRMIFSSFFVPFFSPFFGVTQQSLGVCKTGWKTGWKWVLHPFGIQGIHWYYNVILLDLLKCRVSNVHFEKYVSSLSSQLTRQPWRPTICYRS